MPSPASSRKKSLDMLAPEGRIIPPVEIVPEFQVRRHVVVAECLSCGTRWAGEAGELTDHQVWEFVNAHAGHRLRFEEITEKFSICLTQIITRHVYVCRLSTGHDGRHCSPEGYRWD